MPPLAEADKAARTIRLFYQGAKFDVDHWRGAAIYVTTWERNNEGVYLDIQPEAGDWTCGGAGPEAPKIMDDALLHLRP